MLVWSLMQLLRMDVEERVSGTWNSARWLGGDVVGWVFFLSGEVDTWNRTS